MMVFGCVSSKPRTCELIPFIRAGGVHDVEAFLAAKNARDDVLRKKLRRSTWIIGSPSAPAPSSSAVTSIFRHFAHEVRRIVDTASSRVARHSRVGAERARTIHLALRTVGGDDALGEGAL